MLKTESHHYEHVVIDDERSLKENEDSDNVLDGDFDDPDYQDWMDTFHMEVYLRSSQAAINFFESLNPEDTIEYLWLDHDLGGTDSIGRVVNYLEERVWKCDPVKINTIYVHTANPVGAAQIMGSNLLNAQYKVSRMGLFYFTVERES